MFGRKSFSDDVVSAAARVNAKGAVRIVFADCDDEVVRACAMLKKRRIATPLIVGEPDFLRQAFKRLGGGLGDDNIIDMNIESNKSQFEKFSEQYQQLRSLDAKPVTVADSHERMKEQHYYAAMVLHNGLAECMLSGFSVSTRPQGPVVEIIKSAEGLSRFSGAMITYGPTSGAFVLSDCVMNAQPSASALADIALASAKTAECLGLAPKVAMLSFSTKDSVKHELAEKVKQATALVKKSAPSLIVDGEIQADAALSKDVARKKTPDSPLAGDANVLIFPDLNSGNISLKLVEQLGGFRSIGPILQGLRKPVNDISRGLSAEEILLIAAVTVLQTQAEYAVVKYDEPHKGFAPEKSQARRQEALDRLPSNIRKIIEEHRVKAKKEKTED